jgi:anti-sigma factor RsiW
MRPQHLKEEICLDYLTGELPATERVFLEKHLESCHECMVYFEQCRELLRGGLASIADDLEMTDDESRSTLPWSLDDGEKRLFQAIGAGVKDRAERESELTAASVLHPSAPKSWLYDRRFRAYAGVGLAIAASIVAAVGLANLLYRLGVKHGFEQSRVTVVAAKSVAATPAAPSVTQVKDDAVLLGQLHNLDVEREAVRAGLVERDAQIARLKVQIEEQRKQSEATEGSFRLAEQQAEQRALEASAQRDDVARTLETQQAVFSNTKKKLETLEQAGTNDGLRIASLENRIQQVTQLLKDKDATIDEQQKFLAEDRDIRELMGARDLYFSETYDVGVDGKRTKPSTRVFLTKGRKSLVFYGYDLDKQPGLKNASTFQAWGMRGPDRNSALNLGAMKVEYIDNTSNRRWVLQFDDPKVLEQINAVFITVEPKGESRVPQGKPMLVTYLKEAPNHP